MVECWVRHQPVFNVCVNGDTLFLLKLVSLEFHLKETAEVTFGTNIGSKIKKLLELEAVSSFLYKKACDE